MELVVCVRPQVYARACRVLPRALGRQDVGARRGCRSMRRQHDRREQHDDCGGASSATLNSRSRRNRHVAFLLQLVEHGLNPICPTVDSRV